MSEKGKFFDSNQLIDEVLKTDPDFKLSDNFANRIAVKAENSFAWKQYWKEFLIYLGVLLLIAGVIVALLFMWFGLKQDIAISFLLSNYSPVSGLFILGIFILFSDRVLLPYLMYRSSKNNM